MKRSGMGCILVAVVAAGCGGSDGGSAETKVAAAMKTSMKKDLDDLHAAAVALQAAAPATVGRGWSASEDAVAIAAMKTAWISARTAYEHVEGATAPVFPDIDIAIDERYDGFLAGLGATGDANPFDGVGVTGMHAIERILYADVIPPNVLAFEGSLPGYQPARFPLTADEAAQFKAGLCAKLVDDTAMLASLWNSAAHLDVSGAFMGLIDLMNEQQEKINNAASGEEESRYSQRTLADLRANLNGTTAIYGLFRPWLKSKPAAGGATGGTEVDASIMTGFTSLSTSYDAFAGDAIPAPPATWSAEMPAPADLATPFGVLYQSVHQAVDPKQPGSIVDNMNKGASLLDVAGFDGLTSR